jgi:hypothetical protein
MWFRFNLTTVKDYLFCLYAVRCGCRVATTDRNPVSTSYTKRISVIIFYFISFDLSNYYLWLYRALKPYV